MKRVFLSILLLLTQNAFAAELLPGPADASRLHEEQKRFFLPESVESRGASEIKHEGATLAIPKNAENIKFVLKSLSIKGSTIYSQDTLKELYADKLGKKIRLIDIYEIADAINQMYASDGYVFSKAIIPAQEITAGSVLIKITEGKIGSVKFEGKVEQTSLIKKHVGRIVTDKPANIHDLEREILLINDLPGVQVETILKPRAGGVFFDVILAAKKEEFENNLKINNYGSRYLGPVFIEANLGVNQSAILPHNQSTVNLLGAIEIQEIKAITANHLIPLNSYGTKFLIEGTYSESQPGYRLLNTKTRSKTTKVRADLSQAIVRKRFSNLYANVTFDGEDSNTDVLDTPTVRDKIRSVRGGISADYVDSFAGNNYLNILYSKGLNTLKASKLNSDFASRQNGDPEYSKVYGVVSRMQSLFGGLAVLAAVSGQYAFDELLASEEFGYGGQTFGRGYDSSEILGDHGLSGLAELRYYGFTDNTGLDFMPFAFYDVGKIWNISDGDVKDASGASAGGGVRVDYRPLGIGTVLTVAKPLTLPRQSPPDSKNGNALVYLFQVGITY